MPIPPTTTIADTATAIFPGILLHVNIQLTHIDDQRRRIAYVVMAGLLIIVICPEFDIGGVGVKKEFSRWRRSRLEQVSRFGSGRTCARVRVCVHRACAPRVCRCRLAGAGAPTTPWPGEGHGCARGENGRNPV